MTTARRRLVVLGASNVARGIGSLLEVAGRTYPTPLDYLLAYGHGRSYGQASTVLIRTLPSLRHCGLWQTLAEQPPLPSEALVTDIGNDILYGSSVEQIADWTDECLSRLAAHCQRLVVTGLPLQTLRVLTRRRYAFFRTLLFPACRLEMGEALERAERLNQLVCEAAQRHAATFVEPLAAWYGLDPIHIRRGQQERAWQAMLGESCKSVRCRSLGLWHHLRVRTLCPAERMICGIRQSRAQPVAWLRDGSRLFLY